jgi:hypothetical protein
MWTHQVDAKSRVRTLSAREPHFAIALLFLTTTTSWIVCLVAALRDGGDWHSLLEAYVATSLLAMYLAPSVLSDIRRTSTWRLVVLFMAVAISAGFPVAQIILANRLGTVSVSNPERFNEGVAIAATLSDAPAPLFAEDYMFEEPWFSTAGRFPAIVFDGYLYHQVKAAGRLRTGIETLIYDRRFGSLLLSGGLEELGRAALSAGYVPAALPPHPNWKATLYVLPAEYRR